MNKEQLIVVLVLLVSLLSGCATLGLSPLKDRMLQSVKYSKRELAAADAENGQIVSKYGTVYDTQAVARLDSIKNRLQAVLPRKDIDFQIHILNSDDVNAMTTGGRHIYIFKGLLNDARSDDELACTLAHEMSHSITRHNAKRTTIGILSTLGSLALSVATRGQESVQTVIALAGQALPATFSRADEREADVLAAAFAYEAGYDISKAKYFFERLAEQERIYNMKVNAELLPALTIATSNYNNALNNYNTWSSYYQNWPNPSNYSSLLLAQSQLNNYASQLQQVKQTYLNFALSNISWFRTHPDSIGRGNLFVNLANYMSEPSDAKLYNFDKSVSNALTILKEIRGLSDQGFMNQGGVRALELFKKAKALYGKNKFQAAEGVLKEVLSLKPDYQEAIKLREDLAGSSNKSKEAIVLKSIQANEQHPKQKAYDSKEKDNSLIDKTSDYKQKLDKISGKSIKEVEQMLGRPMMELVMDKEGNVMREYSLGGKMVQVYFKKDIAKGYGM